jgi:hypothetical protein
VKRSVFGHSWAQNKEKTVKSLSLILLFAIFTTVSIAASSHGREQSVSIGVHHETAVPRAGFKIKFAEMVEDSRCPADVNCVWAGNAKVKIEVRRGRRLAKTFELNSTTAPNVIKYNGYEIKLKELTPLPRTNARIDPDKCEAVFEITKVR